MLRVRLSSVALATSVSPTRTEAGNVMPFGDRARVEEFLAGPLAAAVQDHPAVRELDRQLQGRAASVRREIS